MALQRSSMHPSLLLSSFHHLGCFLHEASKMSLQNKLKKKKKRIPTVSRVNCHGTIETETQTQPCFPGKALLYKLHLGFAYFCLYAA